MASRIQKDKENTALVPKKDGAFSASPRRALGDLYQFYIDRISKPNEETIVPPVAQFPVFDRKPTEVEVKNSEPTSKLLVATEIRKDNINAPENAKVQKANAEKQPDPQETLPSGQPLQEIKDVVESSTSNGDSSVLLSKNESQLVDNDEKYNITAQSESERFFHVVEYRQDIYKYMKQIEVKNRANPLYMCKQPDITYYMRSIIVDWLVDLVDEFDMQSVTLHLAVSYLDRFLSNTDENVASNKLQLIGTTTAFIASKYEEVRQPPVLDFVYLTDFAYSTYDVLCMEVQILHELKFELGTPTSLAFLSHYCISNGLSRKTFHLASYVAELCLLEGDPYLQYLPSQLAAGALATARHCLRCERCARAEQGAATHLRDGDGAAPHSQDGDGGATHSQDGDRDATHSQDGDGYASHCLRCERCARAEQGAATHSRDGDGAAPHSQDGDGGATHSQDGDGDATHSRDGDEDATHSQDGDGDATHSQDGDGDATHSQDGDGYAPHSQDGDGGATHSQDGDGDATHSRDGDEDATHSQDGDGDATHSQDGDGDATHSQDGDGDATHSQDGDGDAHAHPHCAAVAWPPALAACSGYSFSALEPVLKELARSHAHAALQPRHAIPHKYQNRKLNGVSWVEARAMFTVRAYQPPVRRAARRAPETEPAAEPETEPAAEPETEPAAEPETEPAAKPETEHAAEPETAP